MSSARFKRSQKPFARKFRVAHPKVEKTPGPVSELEKAEAKRERRRQRNLRIVK